MNVSQPIDDRAESFKQIGDVAKVIAERHCGVAIDQLTHHRWQQTMAILREVDTFSDERASSHEEVLDLLRSGVFDARYPLLSRNSLGHEIRAKMLDRTHRILKIGHAIKNATSMDDFIELRIAEGTETALYLSDTATDAVYQQAAFREIYEPTMRSMAVTANLLDSITDGHMDYSLGMMIRRPDGEYYRRLASAVFTESGLGSRALLHIPVMKEFATMSWRRLQNRIAHRDSATSSLRLFER